MKILDPHQLSTLTNALRKAARGDRESAKVVLAEGPSSGILNDLGAKAIAQTLEQQAADADALADEIEDLDGECLAIATEAELEAH